MSQNDSQSRAYRAIKKLIHVNEGRISLSHCCKVYNEPFTLIILIFLVINNFVFNF